MKFMKRSGQDNKPGFWSFIQDDIACVFERDPAARSRLEVLTTYPGVHAIIVYRLANIMWLGKWKYMARLLSYLARIWTTIDIHPGATIGRRFFIDHGAGVVIGETAEIGNDVTIYHGVTLGGTSWSQGKRHPTLKDWVVIGAGAKVLGPITLGTSVKVGANSVVIKDVPSHKTIVGIPGKVVQAGSIGSLNPYGVDLNHHLIPDPVADAIACLVDRVKTLEMSLADHKEEHECEVCDAREVCEPSDSVTDTQYRQTA